MDASLTEKQAQVLSVIEETIARTGRPPTYRDIARECGYTAVGTAQDHVRTLVAKGYLTRDRGVARSFRPAHHTAAVAVPILGRVPAGRPIEAIAESEGSVSFPARRGANELFALRVTGDSMVEAGILDGDFVVVRKQSQAESGDIVVAMIDGEATVKRLERKAGRVRLLPANARYAPIEIPAGSENTVVGRVVGVQRMYA